jgi:hypothetical protein
METRVEGGREVAHCPSCYLVVLTEPCCQMQEWGQWQEDEKAEAAEWLSVLEAR